MRRVVAKHSARKQRRMIDRREADAGERERLGLESEYLIGGYDRDMTFYDDAADEEYASCLCPDPWECLGDCLPEHPAPGVRFISE